MVNNDLHAGIIYQTKDYDKFTLDNTYNRTVDEKHVVKIQKSYAAYGDRGNLFPVVVDDKFKVIDGQHRFTARKELGLIIYYIMDIGLDSKVLGGINDAMKKWVKDDFAEVSKDSEIIIEVQSIVKEIDWDLFNTTAALGALSINLKNILSTDPKVTQRQMNNLLRKKPLFVFYMKLLQTKITDINTFSEGGQSRIKTITGLVSKLSKNGVAADDIIVGTYAQVVGDLYGRLLIK